MNLMIVESPNKVKKISAILGPGWEVLASVGHIRDLPKNALGVADDYSLEYEYIEPYKRKDGSLSSGSKVVVDRLRTRVNRSTTVYLATDPDREGEAIAWHLMTSLNLSKYLRVTFNAITETDIRKALASPRQIDMKTFRSQEARRAVDRLVGYKVSPILRQQTNLKLSAGRVQTVALRLVADRQREIESFEVTKHFGAEAIFDNETWTAQWDTAPYLRALGTDYILDKQLAVQAASNRDFRVSASDTKPARKSPPPPFITATLLQAASVTCGFSPEKSAAIAQSLFGQGLITYHRTDSQNFSPEALQEIRTYAENNGLPIPAQARKWKSKESAQEAHEAIRPTHIDDHSAGESEDERRLYALIWSRAVASQLVDAEYSVNTLSLEAVNSLQPFTFKATGRTLTSEGWLALTALDAAEEGEEDPDANDGGQVPALPIGTLVRSSSTHILDKRTKPPNRYTQASLIKKLEAEGIGRPSTYANILGGLLTKAFLTEAKRLLYATEIGLFLIDSLRGRFAFVELDYTRKLEQALDDIADGKTVYTDVVSSLDSMLLGELSKLQLAPQTALAAKALAGHGPQCPRCKEGSVRQVRGQSFHGCSRYSEGCKFTIACSFSGKKLTDKQIEALCTKGKTSTLKGFKSAKTGKNYDAALECNASTEWKLKPVFAPR
jgi:DNA topoisomerase-1